VFHPASDSTTVVASASPTSGEMMPMIVPATIGTAMDAAMPTSDRLPSEHSAGAART
jgi:hypothetical protein